MKSFKGGEITIVAWGKDPRELLNVRGRLWRQNLSRNGKGVVLASVERVGDREEQMRDEVGKSSEGEARPLGMRPLLNLQLLNTRSEFRAPASSCLL